MASDREIAAAAKAMKDMRNDLLSLPLARIYERLAEAGLKAAEAEREAEEDDAVARYWVQRDKEAAERKRNKE